MRLHSTGGKVELYSLLFAIEMLKNSSFCCVQNFDLENNSENGGRHELRLELNLPVPFENTNAPKLGRPATPLLQAPAPRTGRAQSRSYADSLTPPQGRDEARDHPATARGARARRRPGARLARPRTSAAKHREAWCACAGGGSEGEDDDGPPARGCGCGAGQDEDGIGPRSVRARARFRLTVCGLTVVASCHRAAARCADLARGPAAGT